MRKMFTRLFYLALFMVMFSAFSELRAQSECDITMDNVTLLTDLTTKCDSDLIQYAVIGVPPGTEYSFNGVGDTTAAGFSTDSTFWVKEGVGFVVQVRNGDCTSNILSVPGADLIQPVSVDTLLLTNARCADEQGELTVVVSGNEDFNVYFVDSTDWTGPSGTYPLYSGTQFQATPGMKYYVTVESVNGCASPEWDSVQFAGAPSALAILDVTTNIDTLTCFGDTATITVSGISGGFAPYIVELTGGMKDTLAAAGNSTFYVTEPGTYYATVTDSFGCSIISDSMAVVANPAPIEFEISLEDVSCADSATGAIYVFDITGGLSGATYTATLVGTDTAMVDVAPTGDTIVFDGLAAGYYSVWVKDDACGLDSTAYDNPNGTGNVISVQSPGEIELVVDIDTAICPGDFSTITATATGGSGSYEYQLDSAGTLLGWQNTASWDVPDATEDYVVWVRDAGASSCEFAWPTISLTAITPVSITSIDTISPTCPGGNDGVINISATGGVGTLWYSLDSISWKENNIFAVMAGTYTVYVRTEDCENDVVSQSNVVVVALDENVIAIDAADSVIECNGEDDAYVSLVPSTWADQTGSDNRVISYYMTTDSNELFMSGDSTTTGDYADLGPGTYYFWAKDNLGCVSSNTITVEVTEADALTVTGTVTGDASCYGTYDGKITVKATGRLMSYGHANTLQAANNLASGAFTAWMPGVDSVEINVGKGTYYVVVKDSCNKKAIDGPFVVDGLDPVEIAAAPVSNVGNDCFGESLGSVEVATATGGSDDLVYTLQQLVNGVWVDVTGYVNVESTVFENLPSDTFKVVVSDLVAGCNGDETDSFIVDGPVSGVSFTATPTDITCNGASDGLITVVATGGVGDYQFKLGASSWREFPDDTPNTKDIRILEPGDYTVWVRDASGCETAGQDFTIDEPSAIDLTVETTNVTAGACVTPDGVIDITVFGGNTDTFDIFIPGLDTTYMVTDSSATFSNVGAGTYTIYAVEVNGNECYAMQEVTITDPESLNAVSTVLDSVGCYGTGGGEILVEVSGGQAPYQVQLPGVDTFTGDSVVFSDLIAGIYSITVEDASGCPFTLGAIEITQSDSIELEATWISDITCADSGQFTVQATGGSGNFLYYAELSQLPAHILVPDPGTSELWQEENLFKVTEPGTYIVWAYDVVNGCLTGGEDWDGVPVNEWRVKVAEPDTKVTVNAEVVVYSECYGSTYDILVPADSVTIVVDNDTLASPVYTVMIDNVTTNSVTGVDPGTYIVTVTHESGCVGTDTVVIAQPEVFEVVLDKGDGEFTCPDVVEGYLEATVVSGGGDTLEYQLWQDGVMKLDYQSVNSFLVSINHEYVVVVRDENGCTDTSNVVVLDPVVEADVTIKDVTCSSDSLASVLVTVIGEPGRSFRVHYDQFEADSPSDTGVSDWFTDYIKLDQLLMFDNESVDDVHYEFWVEDTLGCVTAKDTLTFDQIITTPLELVVTEGATVGCETEVTISASGGVSPYVFTVDGEVVSAGTIKLGGGDHTIMASDEHDCTQIEEITLDYSIVMDTTIYTGANDTAHYVNASAGIDTMLEVGQYMFYPMVDTCEAELTVNVMEGVVPVLDTMSPTDTIADNHAVFVMEFEDVVMFNNSVMGYLTVTDVDSTDARLEIPITSDMVSGNTVTVDYDYTVVGKLDLNTTYIVQVDSGVVVGNGGIAWGGLLDNSWKFTTGPDYATGLEPEVEALDFKVYPNPFNDFIRIDNSDKIDRVIISNIAGQRVLDIENPTYEIRTGNLVTGVYVVTLISNNEIVKSDRIIKR